MRNQKNQTVRIIAGRLRGRRLRFDAISGLRPTSDRVRETLFNWLQPAVAGSVCLDLCAGSGALSFESLSRGAAKAVLVELHPKVARTLNSHVQEFQVPAEVVVQDALLFLQTTPVFPVDIIFVDPPFELSLCQPLLIALETYHWLEKSTFLYVECAREQADPMPFTLPRGWHMHRQIQTAQVTAYLLTK